MMCRSYVLPALVLVLLIPLLILLPPSPAAAADVGYYFDLSNELIDLPYPGSEFYGEVDLSLLFLNNLRIDVNAYVSPGEYDYLGNYISSPLVAGLNFGIDKFGANSSLISSSGDFDTFMSLYDVTMPADWGCKWGGVAGELGKFEFWYKGTGDSRQDPLVILIAPKSGVVIPEEFVIDSVDLFVEECPQGYCFSMHVGDLSTDPAYWETGHSNVESAFFAASGDGDTLIVPEPATSVILLVGTAALVLRMKRR